MRGKSGGSPLAVILAMALASSAGAWPPFPPFQCPWHEDPDCPRSHYSCLHYWTPIVYRCRAYHTPPRYVYGCPIDCSVVQNRIDDFACRTTSPAERAAKYIETGRERTSTEPEKPAEKPTESVPER